jgi:2,5-diketo-D-gluconate reductase A
MTGMTDAVPTLTAPLPGGSEMPLLGFGTWQLKGQSAHEATLIALQTGYRHVDTATMYQNEAEVGSALASSGLARDEVFVTTKLPPDHVGREMQTLTQSLELMGLDAVDLWLVHWPPAGDAGIGVWRQFLSAREQGKVKDVGVSNYSLNQLDELAEATGAMPAVNQIPWSPLLFDAAVLAGHRERGVVVEGYSGLRGGALENEAVVRIAEQCGRTPAQVIIRWHLQHQVVVIPKSADPGRIAANAAVADFELSADDMAALDRLGQADTA